MRGDAQVLSEAVGNLLANAIAYSPKGSNVGVGVKVVDGVVEIAVTDRGIGIAEGDQERVFERFYRADQARSRRTGGTGLGLAIVKHAVQRHGGEVRLWSRPGRGSTFTIRLPQIDPPADQVVQPKRRRKKRPTPKPAAGTPPHERSQPHDSRPDRRGRAGSRRSPRLPAAPRGLRGRDRRGRTVGARRLQDRGADIVLLDLMLPGMSGTEVCRQIRATSRVPIIMLTAKDSEVDIVVGLELGADDYVTKPYSSRELLARMRAVLRRLAQIDADLDDRVLDGGRVVLDIDRHTVAVDGREISMPLKEFELLEVLMRNAGRVLTRGQLIDRVWGTDYFGDTKTLDVHIKRIRSRIEQHPSEPSMLMTVRGLGLPLRGLTRASQSRPRRRSCHRLGSLRRRSGYEVGEVVQRAVEHGHRDEDALAVAGLEVHRQVLARLRVDAFEQQRLGLFGPEAEGAVRGHADRLGRRVEPSPNSISSVCGSSVWFTIAATKLPSMPVLVGHDQDVAHLERAGVGDVHAVGRRVRDRGRLRREHGAATRSEDHEGAEGKRRDEARFHGSSRDG